jgi:hypothetical protein
MISDCNVSPPALISSAGIWSVPGDHLSICESCNYNIPAMWMFQVVFTKTKKKRPFGAVLAQLVYWWAEQPGFDSWQGKLIFLCCTASRLHLGPTKSPVQWVPGDVSLGVKRQGHEAERSPPCSAEVKNSGAIPPLPIHHHGRDTFAFLIFFKVYFLLECWHIWHYVEFIFFNHIRMLDHWSMWEGFSWKLFWNPSVMIALILHSGTCVKVLFEMSVHT